MGRVKELLLDMEYAEMEKELNHYENSKEKKKISVNNKITFEKKNMRI